MKTKIRVYCKNKKEFIKLQLKLFPMGYWWGDGGTNVYIPKRKIYWENGVTLIIYENKRLLFSSSGNDKNNISYKEWINLYDNSEKEKIINFVNELFE